MSRLNSFHLAPALWREPFVLDGEEARHLTRVLRARVGDAVRLFDGRGRWGIFRIERIGKRDAGLGLVEEHAEPAPAFPLVLAVGWSKGLRRGFLLEKAVELGATAVWFWQAARSQGEVPEDEKFRLLKVVQDKTDEYIGEIESCLAKKEKELLEV